VANIHRIEGGKSDALARAGARHEGIVRAIEKRYEPLVSSAKRRLEDVQERWDFIFAQVQREPSYSGLWYFPALAFLAVCEVPVNQPAFELFFQDIPIRALLIAFLVGVVLMLLAHFIGVGIRRIPHNISRMTEGSSIAASMAAVPSLLSIVFCSVMVFALCYGVGVLRQAYLLFQTQPNQTFSDLVNNEQVVQAAAQVLFQVGLGIEGWIFFGINIAIVSVGALIAFFCHDGYPGYAEIDQQKKVALTRLERIEKRHGQALAIEERRHTNEVNRINRRT